MMESTCEVSYCDAIQTSFWAGMTSTWFFTLHCPFDKSPAPPHSGDYTNPKSEYRTIAMRYRQVACPGSCVYPVLSTIEGTLELSKSDVNVLSDDSSNSHSNTVNIREKGGRRRRQKEEEEGEWRIFLCFKSYLNFGTYKLTHPKVVSHHVLHNCKVSRKFIDTISLRVQVWQKISLISRYFLYLNFGT